MEIQLALVVLSNPIVRPIRLVLLFTFYLQLLTLHFRRFQHYFHKMQGNRSTYSSFFLKLTSITLQTVMPQPERHFCLYRVIGADFCFFISGCTLRKHLLSLSHASKAFLPSGGSSLFYAKMFYSTLL